MLAAWRFATGVRPAPLSPRVKSRMQSRFVHTHKASLRVTSAAPAGTSAGREDPGGEGKQGTESQNGPYRPSHPSTSMGRNTLQNAQNVLGNQQGGIRVCAPVWAVPGAQGNFSFGPATVQKGHLHPFCLTGTCIVQVATVRRHLSFGV